MNTRNLALPVLLSGALFTAGAARAESPTSEAIREACHPGKDKQTPGTKDYPGGLSEKGSGLTPQSLPGATTVSAAEAKCLLDRFGESAIVIAAVDDARRLPKAITAPWTASSDDTGKVQEALTKGLAQLTEGDTARPILVYCHNDHCFLSYNAAFRIVKAGYKHVFWMRPGLDGWEQAGFAFQEPERPKIPQGLTERYQREIAECDKFYFDYDEGKYTLHAVQFDSLAESDQSWSEDLAKAKESRRTCLQVLRRSVEGNAPALEDLEQRIARSDAEVEKQYRDARANVEADAAKHFGGWFDAQDVSKLRTQLALARNMKTTAERCGRFDYSLPPPENGALEARRLARKRYGDCITAWRDDSSFSLAEIEFSSATTLALATERYTCSKRNAPKCLPDSVWHAVGDLATRENLKIIKNAEEIYTSRHTEVDEEIDRLNQWASDVNEMVERYNAEQ